MYPKRVDSDSNDHGDDRQRHQRIGAGDSWQRTMRPSRKLLVKKTYVSGKPLVGRRIFVRLGLLRTPWAVMSPYIEDAITIGMFVIAPGVPGAYVIVTGRMVAKRGGSDLRLVLYLYSLGITATILLIWWALGAGGIDAKGNFQGTAGAVLQFLFDIMVDVWSELKLLSGLAALVLFPQLLSYCLAGLFGCAATPVLVGTTFRFIFWSGVKFLAMAGGIFAAFVVSPYVVGWPRATDVMSFASPATKSLLNLLVALYAIHLYRTSGDETEPEESWAHIRAINRLAARVHAWANRNNTPP